jgi:toxin secretion/phage lysis holin
MNNQLMLMTTSGAVGGIVAFLFGRWSELLTLFIFVIILDYLAGVAAAIISGQGLSSKVGMIGIVKKFGIVAIIVLGNLLDQVGGTDFIMMSFLWFFIANELVSITENYGRMGLPLPENIQKMIQVLRNKGDKS